MAITYHSKKADGNHLSYTEADGNHLSEHGARWKSPIIARRKMAITYLSREADGNRQSAASLSIFEGDRNFFHASTTSLSGVPY